MKYDLTVTLREMRTQLLALGVHPILIRTAIINAAVNVCAAEYADAEEARTTAHAIIDEVVYTEVAE